MLMISGWWLLATFSIGGCVGIMIATLLHLARYDGDREQQFLAGAPEFQLGTKPPTLEA
jgi:hypothetical protein